MQYFEKMKVKCLIWDINTFTSQVFLNKKNIFNTAVSSFQESANIALQKATAVRYLSYIKGVDTTVAPGLDGEEIGAQ